MEKVQLFDQNHGLSPLKKCQFCVLFKSMFILSKKACLLRRTSPNSLIFIIIIFAIYYMGIQGVTRGYKGLQGFTRGYRRLQGVTGGYKGLEKVTSGYRGLQRTIETFF